MIFSMTKLEQAVDTIRQLPPEAQNQAVDMVLAWQPTTQDDYKLSSAEEDELQRRLVANEVTVPVKEVLARLRK